MIKTSLKVLGAASLCVIATQSASAFTAVSAPATVNNINNNPAPGAQVGDQFSIVGGSFAAHVPGPGDPTITGGDLNRYRYNMDGTVASVAGAVVDYTGSYRIFYDSNIDGLFNAGDFSYSFGTLAMTIDFSGVGPAFIANGTLHQTAGPDAGFPSSGFPNADAEFTGTYTVNSLDGSTGIVQGTITSTSVPDAGSSLVLTGIAALGIVAARRRMAA